MSDIIYKICECEQWMQAEIAGVFHGSDVDIEDGYIHFSSAGQVKETAEKHFSGLDKLVLIAVDSTALGDGLKYEVSRGGALFPHFYGILPMKAVVWVKSLRIGDDGAFLIPDLDK